MDFNVKALLDTNILINRETAYPKNSGIGKLFFWLDQLKFEKYIHPRSLEEIRCYKDEKVVAAFEVKLGSYIQIPFTSKDDEQIAKLRFNDKTRNDEIDTDILKELVFGHVDIIITEDRGIHRKGRSLGFGDSIFTIEEFIEYAASQSPQLIEHKVPTARIIRFGELNIDDPFFDSFKSDYSEFAEWFRKKSYEKAYVCIDESDKIKAFLYMKREDESEKYTDISPPFGPGKRFKIGTFKVELNGYRIGEKFLRLIFENAIRAGIFEVYVTLFEKSEDQRRLVSLLLEWGFTKYGVKTTANGVELVLIRKLKTSDSTPKFQYPNISRSRNCWIVPIYPDYHTDLLPESILSKESALSYLDLKPYRNSIQKVYVSRSIERKLSKGDTVLFYRTRENGPGHYSSVVTTMGIVDEVYDHIRSEDDFVRLCRKLSVFSDDDLRSFWRKPGQKPFIVKFLNAITLPNKINLKTLREMKIRETAPRGFEPISIEDLLKVSEAAGVNANFIID